MPQEFSAGAIVINKNKCLLLHYEEGHWDLPKGHIEKGETEKQAAKREIEEETGIQDVRFMPDFKEKLSYFYKRDNKTFYKEVAFFIAKTKEEKVKLSFEHIGYEWLPYKEAIEKLTFKNAKEILKKANEFLR